MQTKELLKNIASLLPLSTILVFVISIIGNYTFYYNFNLNIFDFFETTDYFNMVLDELVLFSVFFISNVLIIQLTKPLLNSNYDAFSEELDIINNDFDNGNLSNSETRENLNKSFGKFARKQMKSLLYLIPFLIYPLVSSVVMYWRDEFGGTMFMIIFVLIIYTIFRIIKLARYWYSAIPVKNEVNDENSIANLREYHSRKETNTLILYLTVIVVSVIIHLKIDDVEKVMNDKKPYNYELVMGNDTIKTDSTTFFIGRTNALYLIYEGSEDRTRLVNTSEVSELVITKRKGKRGIHNRIINRKKSKSQSASDSQVKDTIL